jgi:hypothetical protein
MNFWHEDTSKWSNASTGQTIRQSEEDRHARVRVSVLFNIRQDIFEVLLAILLKHQTGATVSFDGYHPGLSKTT